MKFGADTDKSLGLAIIQKRGFSDMPARLSPFLHNWGDEIQPLVDIEDIAYAAQTFEVDVIFDPRLLPAGSMQDAIDSIESKGIFVLDLEHPVGSIQYDNFTVKFSAASNRKRYGLIETATFVFYCQKPEIYTFETFPQTATSNIRIGTKPEPPSAQPPDWYDFWNFRMHVSRVVKIKELEPLKNSKQTVNLTSAGKLAFRGLQQIEIDAFVVDDDEYNSFYYLGCFKNILTSPGIKDFYFYGESFEVFCSEGFKVSASRDQHLLSFTVKLNVL